MISFRKCTGICNTLSPKIFAPKETKGINVKAYDLITNKDEDKQWQSIFHVLVNANSIVQYVIETNDGIIKHVNVNVKSIIV